MWGHVLNFYNFWEVPMLHCNEHDQREIYFTHTTVTPSPFALFPLVANFTIILEWEIVLMGGENDSEWWVCSWCQRCLRQTLKSRRTSPCTAGPSEMPWECDAEVNLWHARSHQCLIWAHVQRLRLTLIQPLPQMWETLLHHFPHAFIRITHTL